MTEALQQLIEAVKTLAPQIWEIYMRQAITTGQMATLGGGIGMALGIIFLVVAINHKFEDDSFVWYLLSVCSLLIGATAVVNGVMHLMNPAFYAIQMLIHP